MLKTMNINLLQKLATAMISAAASLAMLAPGALAQGNPERRLEGTWTFQITLRDCTSGTPLGAPFFSLLTFNQGGTMTETTANSMFYPAERGPGHGVWSHVKGGGYGDASDRRYQARSLALITANGVLTQAQIIRQNIQMGLNPNTLQTTSASVEFYKPDGTLVRKGCATAQATRF
jgi:hypothetical protein